MSGRKLLDPTTYIGTTALYTVLISVILNIKGTIQAAIICPAGTSL